ncbi:MAG: methylated-DNA--[protein]-cysteine S-methyltransferase [Proteobacteria bacterium]|nr:MAG: methylated-DNA--[protein]-cysteine S-methyltransferase [Pseudomonadota bacterium]
MQKSSRKSLITPDKTYVFKQMQSPVGELTLIASDIGLAAILWENDDPMRVRLSPLAKAESNAHLDTAIKQLEEYFTGKRKSFELKLDFKGTDFQKEVWEILLRIPYGETTTYGAIAKEIKRPKASRAVGAANGKNPISIVAACHRVIGASGALTGFAGGLETKAFLLGLEAIKIP